MPSPEICFLTATELTQRIRAQNISAKEVMETHLAQINRVNPKVNAIAMNQARVADNTLSCGDGVGPLHGLPVAHKDLVNIKESTYGLWLLYFPELLAGLGCSYRGAFETSWRYHYW